MPDTTIRISAEFLVEPFEEGHPGPHVHAAVASFEERGLTVEQGPFGNTTTGPVADVLAALAAGLEAAVGAGATRVTVNIATE